MTMKMRGFTTKYAIRKLAERLLPAEISRRPKSGFNKSEERRGGKEARSPRVSGVQTCALPIYDNEDARLYDQVRDSQIGRAAAPGRNFAPPEEWLQQIGRASWRERGEISAGEWSSDVCSSDL